MDWRFWLGGIRKKAMDHGWPWLAVAVVGGVALVIFLVALFIGH